MRTLNENADSLQYDLTNDNMDLCDNPEYLFYDNRSSFYDFAASHGAVFSGYEKSERSEFVDSF